MVPDYMDSLSLDPYLLLIIFSAILASILLLGLENNKIELMYTCIRSIYGTMATTPHFRFRYFSQIHEEASLILF